MQSERIRIPNTATLLKISLGLIIVAIISSAFVYADTASVSVGGKSYNIDYEGDGVSVLGIEADLDFISLIISVDVTGSPGTLDITFNRSFFDSKFDGNDEDFIVLIDADEASFSEISTTANSRTLSIVLPEGTEEIEIIGSVFDSTAEPEPIEPEEPETVEKEIPAPFVDPTKDPKSYVQRYLNEPSYKEWFEEDFPDYTFYEALDITKTQFDALVAEITSQTTEIPVEEKPEEKPVEEKPKTECGPGTILKDGVCVLDQRCGPGTVMKDGACVVAPQESNVTPKESGKELLIALIAGFIVAGTVGLILALISKASKSKN